MVMSVINGVTTYYASSSYVVEVDGSDTTVRKTYSTGSTSLAVRTIVNGTTETLNWLLSDHLGSSSITTNADGSWNSEIRYSAFGETRYSLGITPTDYRYTGQLEQADVNLYYYNARYYDAVLGRFIQADIFISDASEAHSYDRYTYVYSNPIKYNDPSGYSVECGIGDPHCRAGSLPLQNAKLVLACGKATNGGCAAGEEIYTDTSGEDHVPMYLLADRFREYGGEVIYMDHSTYDNTDKYAEAIANTISINRQADYYIASHSAGANATVGGLIYLQNITKIDMSIIKKRAILDSYLWTGNGVSVGYPADFNSTPPSDLGNQSNADDLIRPSLSGDGTSNVWWIGRSLDDTDLTYFPTVLQPIENYDVHHTELAVDEEALNDIWDFFFPEGFR